MNPETIPGFDCLEYKWKVQADIYEEIKDMTADEQIAYFRKAAEQGSLGNWWRKIRQNSITSPAGDSSIPKHLHQDKMR